MWPIIFLTADETCRFQDLLLFLFLTPQVGKSINDDAKDEVEDNDDDHEEEEQVVDHPGSKKGLLLTHKKPVTALGQHYLLFIFPCAACVQ